VPRPGISVDAETHFSEAVEPNGQLIVSLASARLSGDLAEWITSDLRQPGGSLGPMAHRTTLLLGAGASRAVSYAGKRSTRSPLDADFFELLQRGETKDKDETVFQS